MQKKGNRKEFRVLIADHNVIFARQLADYLRGSHFSVHHLHDGLHVSKKIMEVRPHFILIDLTLPNFGAFECLEFLKNKHLLGTNECRVIVLSTQNMQQNVKAVLNQGASDYLVKPIQPVEVLKRLALHLQARKRLIQVEEIKSEDVRQTNYYLHLGRLLVRALSAKATTHQIQFQVTRMLAMALNAVRISLVDLHPDPRVTASSDDPKFTNFPIDLVKYPELDYVLSTGRELFIENVKHDGTLSFIQQHLKEVQFNSMIIIPLLEGSQAGGALSVKFKEMDHISDADIRLCQLGAEALNTYWHLSQPHRFTKAS